MKFYYLQSEIRLIGIVIATLALGTLSCHRQIFNGKNHPSPFSFGVIADCQYCPEEGKGVRKYSMSNTKLQECVTHLNTLDLAYTIHLGDFIDKDWESFIEVAPIYKQLKVPAYHVLGNHDFSVDDKRKDQVRKKMGMPSDYYHFRINDWRFVVLNGNDISFHAYPKESKQYNFALRYYEQHKIESPKWNGAIGEAQIEWLKKVLDKASRRGEKVVLFCHFPIYPENVHNLWNDKRIIEIIESYPAVRVYISGHNHAGNYGWKNGIHYLTLKGMVDTDQNSYGVVRVFPDSLHIMGYGREESRKLYFGKDGKDHTDTLPGHHYPVESPRIEADSIKYSPDLPKPKLESSAYHTIRGGIRNSLIKFTQEKKGRVAFLGGSITYNGGWRDSICNYLTRRFPETEFDFIAAGIPSMGTTPAAFRLERDVLKNGPVDLLFEEAAVNDATNGRTKEEQILAMEGIVRHIRQNNPASDIVIMHFVDPSKMEVYRSGKIPEVIQNHEKVAGHYHIPTINLAKEVTDRIDAGEFTWEDDFKNLHPSPFGQGVYSNSIQIFLENAWESNVADEDKLAVYDLPNALDESNYQHGILVPVKKYGGQNGWNYVEKWVPQDGKATRTNYTDVPMLVNEGTGEILKFSFTGDAAGIAIAAGPDAGMIEYSIDEGPWRKLDLFTRWSSQLHLPWYYTLASGLEPVKHSLKIRVLNEKNPASMGNACRIRYFYVNQSK